MSNPIPDRQTTESRLNDAYYERDVLRDELERVKDTLDALRDRIDALVKAEEAAR